jgi:hypothetical protein
MLKTAIAKQILYISAEKNVNIETETSTYMDTSDRIPFE